MAVLEELGTRLVEWFESLQKDAPMDLWLQAVVLVVFCVGFNATSWLLAPQKGKAKVAPTVPTVPTVAASPNGPTTRVVAIQLKSAKPSPVVGAGVTSAAKSPKSPKTPKSPEEAEETQVTPLFFFDGLDFDGDRIVNLREKPYYFEEQLGGAMSISFIARWDAFALRSRIIDFGDGPLADNIVIANLETGRSLIVEVFRGPSKKRLTMPGCLALGETHRYLLSISESGLMRMLQDGSQLGVQPQGYAPRSMERRKLLVGGSNWSSDENFQGEISELKIWHGEVSWQTAFPNETPLPPPRPPKEVKPEATEDQADDLEVEAATSRVASPEPPAVAVAEPAVPAEPAEPAQEVEPPAAPLAEPAPVAPAEPAQAAQDAPIQPADDEEGWTAVSKSARKADKKAKAKLHEMEVKTEVKKAVVVPAPPPPPDHGKRQKGRHKPEVKLSPATKPQSPPTPPPPPVKEHKKLAVQEQRSTAVQEEKPPVKPVQEQRSPLRQKGPSVQEHKLELPETKNKRGKAWADIPPEGTPPSSPPTAGLVLTVKNEEASEVLSPHTPDNGEDKLEDTGFEVLSGKKRPKVEPEVVTGPGGRLKAQEGNGQVAASEPVEPASEVPVSPQGTTLSPKVPAAAPSSLSPLEKEILRLEKKQREVEKLKQRQADGEELDHLQLKKLSCKDEMMQKLQELNLKKALERAGVEVNQVEGHGGSPEPWDLPKVPVDLPQIAPSSASSVPMGRTPLKAPREGFRPSGARQDADQGDSQLSSGAEIFTPGAMNSEVQFQAMQQMQQMAMVGGVGVEMENPEVPEESWDACWEWLQNGYCPRGETCRWDHPALQFPDGSLAVWPGHQPEMQTEQVFVMIPAENFSCQGACGSWTGPFAGDQMVGAMACDTVAMPCACSGVCGCGCPQLPTGDAPFCGDSNAVPAIAADGQVAR